MSFVDFCQSCGIKIRHLPTPSNVWHRYPTVDKPGSRNGSVYWDGVVGFAKNWATMEKAVKFESSRKLDEKELEKAKRIQKEQYERRMRYQAQSKESARSYFEGLPILRETHPYLEAKQLSILGCKGLKEDGNRIVIPIYINGVFGSYQTIDVDGTKKFAAGCPVGSGYFLIARQKPNLICIAEGFATGLTIFQCITDANVYVCFNAGNLVAVAEQLRGKLKLPVVICADNDHETEKEKGINAGVESASRAGQILNCAVAFPVSIKGTDWNDAYIEWKSKFRVKAEILRHVGGRV